MTHLHPDAPSAAYPVQAGVFGADWDGFVGALGGYGVVSGCAVTQSTTPNLTVRIAAGVIQIGGALVAVSAHSIATNVAPDATLWRWYLVEIDGTGVAVWKAGSPLDLDVDTNPVKPRRTAGKIILADVIVPPASTTILNAAITPRQLLPAGGGVGVLNVKTLGAAGNGTTDDTAIISGAIATLIAAGGGTLYFPRGRYRCTSSLVIALATIASARGQIVFTGDGRDVSSLYFPTDLGTGVIGLRPTGFDQYYSFRIEHMGVLGPDEASGTLHWGTNTVNMDGVALNSRAQIVNCTIRGFRAGIRVTGDHNSVVDTICNRNYFGMLWSTPENALFQVYDHVMIGVDLAQSFWASIACDVDSVIGRLVTNLVQLCNSAPYGLYRLPGTKIGAATPVSGASRFLWKCVFNELKWEGAGNAFIRDANQDSSIEKCYFNSSFHALRNTAYLPGQPRTYGVVIGKIIGTVFDRCSIIDDGNASGAEFQWDVGEWSRNDWRGQPTEPIDVPPADAYSLPIISSTVPLGTHTGQAARSSWSMGAKRGRLAVCKATIVKNDLLRHMGGGNVGPMANAGHFAGTALHAAAVDAYVWIQEQGVADAVAQSDVTSNTYLSPDLPSNANKVRAHVGGGDANIGSALADILAGATGRIFLTGEQTPEPVRKIHQVSTQNVASAASSFFPAAAVVQFSCPAGTTTLTSTPTLADGRDGEQIILRNYDATDTVVFSNEGTLAGSNLKLSAGTIPLGPGDSLVLLFDAVFGAWVQIGWSNVV